MKRYILYIDMVDTARTALAQSQVPAGHRVVEVELTPEQVELIQPQVVGGSGDAIYYEEIHPISIQERERINA